MAETTLRRFVEEVMGLSAGYPGMGGASAGIVGAAGAHDQIISQLRSSALAFTTEYTKPNPNQENVVKLSERLEGALHAVKLVNGISDIQLEKLIADLHFLAEISNK